MEGVQRFLVNQNNHIRNAVALTGPVRTITDAVIAKPISRQGSAGATVSGTYSGTEEATYELEVVNTTPTVPLVTAPVFSGSGNGEMSGLVGTGLSARSIVVELADLGNLLTAASTTLQDVKIVARTPGAAANALKLRIDRSGLTHTAQGFSLLNPIQETTKNLKGPEYDWNTAMLSGDGTVPNTAKRISFGEDRNNIYVQYKEFVNGEFVYSFEPAIRNRISAGTTINFVTGVYTVTLYNGATLVETYSNVVTLFDLLNKIKTTSTLLNVEGAIAADSLPGGLSVADLQLTTDAYAVSNTGSGSRYATGFAEVSVSSTSPTELITATCWASSSQHAQGAGLGQEFWEIRGSVSGLITPKALSGELIVSPTFQARIPLKVPDGFNAAVKGTFVVKDIQWADRTEEEPKPGICPVSLTLGINATDKVITFTYTKRPISDNCGCDDSGSPLNPECLGLVTSTGGSAVSYQADTITKLVAMYDWVADVVKDNSSYALSSPPGAFSSVLDPPAAGTSGGYGANTVAGVQDPFIGNPSPKSASRIVYYDSNGAQYAETQAPTLMGYVKESLHKIVELYEKSIAQIDKLPAGAYRTAGMAAWDVAFGELQNDVDTYLTGLPSAQTESVEAEENLAANDWVLVYEPEGDGVRKTRKAVSLFDPLNVSYIGFVISAATAGNPATVYRWGVLSATIVTASTCGTPATADAGQVVAAHNLCLGKTGQFTLLSGVPQYTIQNAPFAYVTKPGATASDPSTLYVPRQGNTAVGMQLLPDRYKTRLNHALISGGISPLGKSDADNDSGDGCWRDEGGEYWWVATSGESDAYAPAFSNVPYYSAKKVAATLGDGGFSSAGGQYLSTKEFGLMIKVTCPEKLKEGDTVVVAIGSAGMEPTYNKGDTLVLGIIAAQDIQLSGGKDGDNIQTWYVTDSVAGARPVYALDTDTPTPYSNGGLGFLINQGTLPYVKGDKFTFNIEGGQFRWRKIVNGVAGAWSGNTNITTSPIALDSGLSATFLLGASPAFAATDLYRFVALQPYAISNVKAPDFMAWEWGTSPAVGVFDLGSDKLINTIGLGYHTIPQGATLLWEYATAAAPATWIAFPVQPTWRENMMAAVMDENAPTGVTARYVRLTATGAPSGAIGWLFAGEYASFSASAQIDLNLQYQVKSSPGDNNPSHVYYGAGRGGRIRWPEGYLQDGDWNKLLPLINWLKANNNEPLMVMLQSTRQTELLLAYIQSNSIEVNDVFKWQPNDGVTRRISVEMPVQGVTF